MPWTVLLVALSLAPLHGLFTTDRIFFVRDLSFFFWSRHLWLRHTLATGEAPWWDPYVAGGQSAIADALNQLLMPVTLAIRLLPSDVVSFNLWVALPLPIAALGMFAFLRRRELPPAAAALGASIFTLAGPTVSMLNTPNLSWSVALIPWVLAACSEVRGSGSGIRTVRIAIAYALQALCGEPVTWVATGALALGGQVYELAANGARSLAVSGPDPNAAPVRRPDPKSVPVSRPDPEHRRFLDLTPVVGGLVAGAGLAAAQLVPTVLAGVRARRAALATPDFWSLHPVALWEAVAPNLFGNYYDAFLADLPWMGALNFARDPFFYSIYVGPLVLLLAMLGAAGAWRRNAFWTAVAIVAVVASLGGYTPFYPLLRKLVPSLMYFRFPVKYIIFAVFACAVLAAEGFARLLTREAGPPRAVPWLPTLAGSVAVAGLLLSLAAFGMQDVTRMAAHWLARSTHLKDATAGAEFLARTAPPLFARASALLLAGALLAIAAGRRRSLLAVMFAAVCADLAVTHIGLNITMPVAQLSPPAWYTGAAGPQRIYIGGRVRGHMDTSDLDATKTWQIPVAATAVEGRMELNAQLPMAPSGWRVREALSYDLPYLWPAEYEATVRRFQAASRDERAAFLRRSGVRRCVFPQEEDRQFRPVAEVRDWNMRVFECDPGATRVFLPPAVAIAPDPEDLAWQREALFDPRLPEDVARVPWLPATSGRAGPPEPPSVRIAHDGAMSVVLEVTLREPGLVVLRDSFDPSWRADADGLPADIVRVNGRYRGVALPAGRHVIRFTYRPGDLAAGLSISVITGLALFGVFWFSRRSRVRDQRGFTLIELMIVMAIIGVILAIAFTEYRGMQAKGNDASAVASLRSIAAAQWQFALTCGNLKYVTTLADLARPVPATGEGFLSPDLTAATPFEKSGYNFQMAAKALDEAPPACNGAPVADGYAATADPVRPGVTGNYYYGVNADRILYVDEEQTYTGNLGETGAAAHGREIK